MGVTKGCIHQGEVDISFKYMLIGSRIIGGHLLECEEEMSTMTGCVQFEGSIYHLAIPYLLQFEA